MTKIRRIRRWNNTKKALRRSAMLLKSRNYLIAVNLKIVLEPFVTFTTPVVGAM